MGLTKVTYSMIEGASVNVLDYGADNTGTDDSSTAIQSAITAAGYGGCVYLPKGTYKVNSTINVPAVSSDASGVNFVGESSATIIECGANGLTSLFNITGTTVKFTNIAIDANSTDVTNGFNVNIPNSADAGCTIQECVIVGFPVGINCAGQNHYYQNNFFVNNALHIKFADDGRNSTIIGNRMLGGNTGIKFVKSTIQAEGVRIIDNTILVTVGNGSGIEIRAGLEFSILANIIDQTGTSSPGIYIVTDGGNTVSSIKMTDNWIAAGEGSYGVFSSGNISELSFTGNTFNSNNSLTTLSAISLATTNTYKIIGNRFLMTYSGGTQDLSTSGSANGIIIANTSNLVGSNVIQDVLNSGVTVGSSNTVEFGTGGPVVEAGAGNPNGSITGVAGSIRICTDGGLSNRIYVCQGGTSWLAIADV